MDNLYTTNTMLFSMVQPTDNIIMAPQNLVTFQSLPSNEFFPSIKEVSLSYTDPVYLQSFSSTKDETNYKRKNLEKNRIAAFKCRQRKKEWIEELTRKTDKLARENTDLKTLIFQLKEEASFIKSQLLLHKQNDYRTCKNKLYLYFI